jgi:hypothetical protein
MRADAGLLAPPGHLGVVVLADEVHAQRALELRAWAHGGGLRGAQLRPSDAAADAASDGSTVRRADCPLLRGGAQANLFSPHNGADRALLSVHEAAALCGVCSYLETKLHRVTKWHACDAIWGKRELLPSLQQGVGSGKASGEGRERAILLPKRHAEVLGEPAERASGPGEGAMLRECRLDRCSSCSGDGARIVQLLDDPRDLQRSSISLLLLALELCFSMHSQPHGRRLRSAGGIMGPAL